jgi:hypothetical protein
VIFILLLVSLVQAAQVSVEIKQRELVVGQTTSFTVKVFDGSPRGLPSVPAGAGLLVRFESQSQQHIVSNFKSTRIVQFNYQLSATQPGNWHLGPVDLVVDGQRLGAAPVTIRVGKAPADQGAAPLIATLSDSAPFLGEVVVYRLQFKRSRPVLSVEWTPPGFDGFIQEKVAEQAQREYTITEGGQQYMVQTIEVPLVAAALGSHTVPPAVLTARYRAQPRARTRAQRPSFDDLFRDSPLRSRGSERKTHSTVPLPTEIRPLPDEGRPVDFGGLVGRFKVSTEASALKVRLGESVTLTTTLEGAGTLHGFRLPPAPSDGGYRAYDDTPEVKAQVRGGLFRSVAVIKRAIVPEAEGMLTVSGLEIPVFDPKMEKYTILQTRPVVIEVQPGEEGAGQVSSFMDGKGDARRDVESLGEDILPVSMPDRMEDMTLAGALPIITALPGLPLLIWLALVANAWLDGRRVDPMVVQRRRLADLPTGPSERLAVLEDVFREVAGIRLGVPAPGLDADAVADLGEEAAEIYRQLERARYGGAGAGLDALAARIRRFMGVK